MPLPSLIRPFSQAASFKKRVGYVVERESARVQLTQRVGELRRAPSHASARWTSSISTWSGPPDFFQSARDWEVDEYVIVVRGALEGFLDFVYISVQMRQKIYERGVAVEVEAA